MKYIFEISEPDLGEIYQDRILPGNLLQLYEKIDKMWGDRAPASFYIFLAGNIIALEFSDEGLSG